MGAIVLSVVAWVVANVSHTLAQLGVARALKAVPNRVSLGFGPTLASRVIGGTVARITWLPLALIVRMRAPIGEPAGEGDLRSRGRLVRLAIFAAGPLMLLALSFASAVWANSYETMVYSDDPEVGVVYPDLAAQRAGLQVGDVIVGFGDREIHHFDDLKVAVGALETDRVEVRFKRGGQLSSVEAQPTIVNGARVLGVAPKQVTAPAAGVAGAVRLFSRWLEQFVRIFTTTHAEDVGGPVVLYKLAPVWDPSETALLLTLSLLQYFLLCFTTPWMAGSRLIMLGVEAVFRRAIDPRWERRLNRGYFVFYALLTMLVVKNDFGRLLR